MNIKKNWTDTFLMNEINAQKKIINRRTKISKTLLRGFRMPHLLQYTTNSQLKIMKELERNDFSYDSSVIIPIKEAKNTRLNYWPHTLNFKPSYKCDQCELSQLWEVPLSFFDVHGISLKN